MGRYTPAIKLDRRKKLVTPNNLDVVRTAMLGVFMILLAFMVALVANTRPNDQKTVDVLATLQNRFQSAADKGAQELTAPPDIPGWLGAANDKQAAPLDEMRHEFPQAFTTAQNNWGALELRFTPDMFQNFILTKSELAQRFFAGLAQPLSKDVAIDPYIAEVTIGIQNDSDKKAQKLLQKTRTSMMSLGVDTSRLLLGYESNSDDIVVRMIPLSRYKGAL